MIMNLRTVDGKKEAGSVLLETVIAIPLFMLLIGGTIWIGQLSYDKQKLVIADRYVAWNVGNRANPGFRSTDIAQDVHDKFFAGLSTERPTIDSPSGTKNRWGHEAWAGVELGVFMPVWTYGFLLAGQRTPGDMAAIQTSVPALYGRDIDDWYDESGQPHYRGHVVLMRSGMAGDAVRTKEIKPGKGDTIEPLAPGYSGIWYEPWPDDVGRER
jgi:hypothetical protein